MRSASLRRRPRKKGRNRREAVAALLPPRGGFGLFYAADAADSRFAFILSRSVSHIRCVPMVVAFAAVYLVQDSGNTPKSCVSPIWATLTFGFADCVAGAFRALRLSCLLPMDSVRESAPTLCQRFGFTSPF